MTTTPESLFTYIRKISALKTEAYFRERQSRGELNAFDTWLSANADVKPIAGDEWF